MFNFIKQSILHPFKTGAFAPSEKHFKDLLTKYLTSVTKSEVVLKNIPPAFVYVCTK